MLTHTKINAVFARGGTSKGLIFHHRDLPASQVKWADIFRHVMGSPDANGRQLDGMGGGISSLSKVVVLAPSARPDADIDYTFVQIGVRDGVVDYGMTCGNMASAVGPFAIDEGLVSVADGPASIRIYNTNTDKIYHAHFAVEDGCAVEEGDVAIPGVSGRASPVILEFLDPAGARTSGLLPTGAPIDRLDVPGLGGVNVSLVDSTNPVVFLRATDVGLDPLAAPARLDEDARLAAQLELVRRHAAVAMGMASSPEEALQSNPKIGLVAPPEDFPCLDGSIAAQDEMDVIVRMVSMGNFHRAIPLSSALCAASAAAISGTVIHEISANHNALRIGTASGVITASAQTETTDSGTRILSASTIRTQRRLFEGQFRVPLSLL